MQLNQYSRNKIFVVGFSGSGKTTFAVSYSTQYKIPYINFDFYYGWKESGFKDSVVGTRNFLLYLPDTFIVDNIPFDISKFTDYVRQFQYASESKKVQLVFTFCSDDNTALERIGRKVEKRDYDFDKGTRLFYKHLINVMQQLTLWCELGVKIDYYNSFTDSYGTSGQFLERLKQLRKYG